MKTKVNFYWMLVLVLGLLVGPALTGTVVGSELSGREIMEKVYNRDEGEDRISTLRMVLVNKFGDQRSREIKQFEKNFGPVEKKIMFFLSPRDVRNTSFMNWSYDKERAHDDDQWIHLPALRKVKRISAENRGDYFMGSDFTYDDLGDRGLDDDRHTLLKTEEIKGETCYVVESVPREPNYMYAKTISWVMKDKWIGVKKEFYDSAGKLLKVLSVKKYQEIQGILTILEAQMHNVQTGHKTIMETSDVQYNTGVKDDLFSERMMRRGL